MSRLERRGNDHFCMSLKAPHGVFRSTGIRCDDLDCRRDIDGWQRLVGATAEREAAHLSFDAAFIPAMAAVGQAFLENFVEHGAVEGRAVLRGEWPGNC